MTPTVSPLRLYRCAECGKAVIRGPGGLVYRHAEPGADHAPRVIR
jgi:DNA-directed RNA polymerase subunit RPC12/RpoP